MSKVRGLVLEGFSPRAPLGAVAPALSLPDVSRFGNDGVFTDVTWVQLPSGLWVMSFNGATSVSNHGTDDSLIYISPRITVLAWVKAPAPAVTQTVASKFDDIPLDRSWDLGASAGGGLLSGFISDDGTVGGHCKSYYSSIIVYDDTWHQVGMVFDAGTFELVIDGAFDPTPTKTIDVAITTIHHGATATCIGSALHGGALMWQFEGTIALVRVYTYALSPGQINKHFEAERRFFQA